MALLVYGFASSLVQNILFYISKHFNISTQQYIKKSTYQSYEN